MPPQRTTNQYRVVEEDELYRRIEHIIGDANLFSEEDLSDDVFFVAGGDREPEFDEEKEGDEGDDKDNDENRKFDEFEGNDVGLFTFAEYDEDDKDADAVWEAIDKRMDSRRKDRREVRLKREIEKYRSSNQQMRTRMSDVFIKPITAVEYFESGFFSIIRSRAWADIGFRSSMEDMYVCVDNFAHDYGFKNLSGGPIAFNGVFNGHRGKHTADFAYCHLLRIILEDKEFPHEIEKVISSTFLQTDAAFAEACSLDAALTSRTTALAATIMGRLLVVANAGDCRAVLCRRGKAIEMSRDHKPVCAKERKQIGAFGGYAYDEYLNGQLNVILSLGCNFIYQLLGRIISTQ
ncbi:probable protein phosphatase 2C 22 [Punica granatum]|uniref:Probable protein phosphatase 2C 22 n=1 Tax=Punica granatum TaxID=22663 RepID=A0A6P8C682_PUNGR|nr:probable protein phosphatase 2C 22 [Punica granatum]